MKKWKCSHGVPHAHGSKWYICTRHSYFMVIINSYAEASGEQNGHVCITDDGVWHYLDETCSIVTSRLTICGRTRTAWQSAHVSAVNMFHVSMYLREWECHEWKSSVWFAVKGAANKNKKITHLIRYDVYYCVVSQFSHLFIMTMQFLKFWHDPRHLR